MSRGKLTRLWWGPLICFIVTVSISIPIASSASYTKALNIALLSGDFLGGRTLCIFIAYLVRRLRGNFERFIRSLILWNMGLCCIAWASALISLILYVKGKFDFVISLWVSSRIKLSH